MSISAPAWAEASSILISIVCLRHMVRCVGGAIFPVSPLPGARQGHRLPGHAPRVTDLLFAYRVTLSLFIHSGKPSSCLTRGPRAILSPSRARRGEVQGETPARGRCGVGGLKDPLFFMETRGQRQAPGNGAWTKRR